MVSAEPVAIVSKVLNTGQSKQRENELQRFGRASDEWQVHGDKWVYELTSKVKRLGHTAINCKDPQASVDWYANTLGFLTSNNCIGPDGNSMGAFMRCNQGDKPVDHHTLNNMGLPGDMDVVAYGHAGYEVTDSVDDLMAGHYHMKTVDEYYHEWGIGRHLLGSQMYDYWRDPHGFTHEHWTDGDLIDASVPTENSGFRDLAMAQYGPEVPNTFGITMPVDQIDKARAENPTIPGMIKEMEIAAKASTSEE
jgi:catechol 2,3-dioxygenase-like lactoylglutathione lyase family enzyme